jgi:hypothetical protein
MATALMTNEGHFKKRSVLRVGVSPIGFPSCFFNRERQLDLGVKVEFIEMEDLSIGPGTCERMRRRKTPERI